jgi:hypothetical protein
MKEVRIRAPRERVDDVVSVAAAEGILGLTCYEARLTNSSQDVSVLSAELSTPVAKRLVDALTRASFFDAQRFVITTRDVRAIVVAGSPDQISKPLVQPAPDIVQELWQYGHVTAGLAGRVLVGSGVLAFGMIEDQLLPMIAGLMFLPMLPAALAVSLSLESRDLPLLMHGIKALLCMLGLMMLAGFLVGTALPQDVRFDEFCTPLTSLCLALGIGAAGALATGDDVGRRELIGLATASQLGLFPVWLGATRFHASTALMLARLMGFCLSLTGLVVAASLTYVSLRLCSRSTSGLTAEQPSAARRESHF